jgi:hypothetical protein
MRMQDIQLLPSTIGSTRSLSWRKAPDESPASVTLLASAALLLVLVPFFLSLQITMTKALPLAVLLGLVSRRLFQLVLCPDRSDVFHPATLVAGYFGTYFALRSVYLYTVPFFARMGRNPYDDYIPAALWCACAGYIAFSSGAASGLARHWLRRVPTPNYWPRSLPASRILFMQLVGLASLIYLFKSGATVGDRYASVEFQRHPPSGVVVLLENLIDLSWVAICIVLMGRKAGRRAAWLLLGMSVAILCIRLGISGGKQALIQPFLEAAIVFHYGRRRFRIWEIVAVGIPVLMLAFGAVNFYRFVIVAQHGSSKNLAEVASRVSSAADMLKEGNATATQQSALHQMVDRDAGVDALALIMKYTPNPFPYRYGLHWLEIPLTFVPRQIWKDKPVDMPSADFEHTYMAEPTFYNGLSSMHLIGDMYRNFSWPGVLCGMFLIGAFLRFFYLFCSPAPKNGTGVFLYAALFPEIIHSFEVDAGFALIIVVRATVLAICVALFLGARFRKIRRAPIGSRRLHLPSRLAISTAHMSD